MEKEDTKLLEESVEFLKKLSVTENDDDRNILSVACENVNGVHRDLCKKISSCTDFAFYYIKDSKSEVIRELKDVCVKLSNLSIKAEVNKFVDSLKDDDYYSSFDDVDVDGDDDDDDDDDSLYDDYHVEENSVYLERKHILTLEIKHYDQTLEFLQNLVAAADKERVSKSNYDHDHTPLLHAYYMINFVRDDLFYASNDHQSSSVWGGNELTLMINNSRSMVANYLNTISTKVTNPTFKEDIVRFNEAGGLRPQMLPNEILDPSLDYTDGKKMSSQLEMTTVEQKSESCSGEVESGSGVCKSPVDLLKNHEAKDEDGDIGYYHDHNKCIEELEERYFPRVITIGNWGPEYEGQGISLLGPSALGDHSEDEFVIANLIVESPKLLSEDECDLANMDEGCPEFPVEDVLDHANMSKGNLKD